MKLAWRTHTAGDVRPRSASPNAATPLQRWAAAYETYSLTLTTVTTKAAAAIDRPAAARSGRGVVIRNRRTVHARSVGVRAGAVRPRDEHSRRPRLLQGRPVPEGVPRRGGRGPRLVEVLAIAAVIDR